VSPVFRSWLPSAVLALALLTQAAQVRAAEAAEAADAEQATTLPTITVQDDEPPLTQPDAVSAAAALRRVPGGTNLIDARQYEQGRSANLLDVLHDQPGVYIGSRGGTDDVKLSIRGAGLDRPYHLRGVLLLQDGIPISTADGNGDFQWLEPLALEAVEVYRGANALEYGSTTLGGAINFLSPTGHSAPGLALRLEGGSYGYGKAQLQAGGVQGTGDWYVSASGYSRDGYQAHSATRAGRLSGNLGYRFSPELETRLYFGYTRSDLALAGSLTADELRHDPRAADPDAIAFDQRHDGDYARLASRTSARLGEDASVDFDLYAVYQHLYHPLFWNPDYLNGLGVLVLDSTTVGAGLRYVSEAPLWGRDNRLVVGLRPNTASASDRRYQNLAGRQGASTTEFNETWRNLELYAEDQHHLGAGLVLTAGFQLAWAARDYRDRLAADPDGDQSLDQHYRGFSPKLGLLYEASPALQWYANASRAFGPPTSLESLQLGGVHGGVTTVPLDAERATTFEIGSRGALARAAWDLGWYRSRVRHELLTLNDAQGNPLGTLNGTPTRHEGIEAAAALVLAEGLFLSGGADAAPTPAPVPGANLAPLRAGGGDRLVLRVAWDWSRFHFTGDPVYGRNALPGIPEHRVRAELSYQRPSGFYASASGEWVPDRYPVDYANSLYADPWFALAARLGYRAERWSAFLEGRNLTGRRYASAVEVIADARSGFGPPRVFDPAEGRAIYAGLEVTW
jgi:iron complex outermembrane receptor protein